jgi:hypothetical protein
MVVVAFASWYWCRLQFLLLKYFIRSGREEGEITRRWEIKKKNPTKHMMSL